VVRGQDYWTVGNVLRAKAPRPEADQRVQDSDHPDDLVDRLGRVISDPLVEGVEELLRARILVDLRLQLDVGHVFTGHPAPCSLLLPMPSSIDSAGPIMEQ
jgi:hypothetical protein